MAGIRVTGSINDFGLEDTAWMAACLQDKHLRPTGGILSEKAIEDAVSFLKDVNEGKKKEGTAEHTPMRGPWRYESRLYLIRSGTLVYRDYYLGGKGLYPPYNPDKEGSIKQEDVDAYYDSYQKPVPVEPTKEESPSEPDWTSDDYVTEEPAAKPGEAGHDPAVWAKWVKYQNDLKTYKNSAADYAARKDGIERQYEVEMREYSDALKELEEWEYAERTNLPRADYYRKKDKGTQADKETGKWKIYKRSSDGDLDLLKPEKYEFGLMSRTIDVRKESSISIVAPFTGFVIYPQLLPQWKKIKDNPRKALFAGFICMGRD
ncbi:MAG: hypothetical protein F6J98_02435 [Moorea sp. SIO4G2]|nr:hypothetical protein [Moorena sp. SIO4G2]